MLAAIIFQLRLRRFSWLGRLTPASSMRAAFSAALLLLASFAVAAVDADIELFDVAHQEYLAAVDSGDTELAITSAKTALDIGSRIVGTGDPDFARLLYHYGDALVNGGRADEGRSFLIQAIDELINTSGKQSPELVAVYISMATASAGFGNEAEQLKWYKRALKVTSSNFGKDSVDYANLAYRTATSVLDESESPIGEKYLKQALAIFETEFGASSKEVGYANYGLGRIAFFRRDSREVTEYLLQALSSFDGDGPADQEQRLKIHAMLVQAYEALDESDNATSHCVAIGRENQLAPDQDFVPLFVISPQYPHTQLRNGVEGHVVLSFTVDEFGFVKDAEVVETRSVPTGRRSFRSSFRDPVEHQSFEASALAALQRYRYAPRFVDGVAVPTEGVTTRTNFRIVE